MENGIKWRIILALNRSLAGHINIRLPEHLFFNARYPFCHYTLLFSNTQCAFLCSEHKPSQTVANLPSVVRTRGGIQYFTFFNKLFFTTTVLYAITLRPYTNTLSFDIALFFEFYTSPKHSFNHRHGIMYTVSNVTPKRYKIEEKYHSACCSDGKKKKRTWRNKTVRERNKENKKLRQGESGFIIKTMVKRVTFNVLE